MNRGTGKSVLGLGILLALTTASGCARGTRTLPPHSSAHARDDLRVGALGHDIGTYLTIGGVRSMQGKSGPGTLLVDTVDSQRLDPPTSIWVENVILDEHGRVELKGYESGRYIGIPDEVSSATGQVAQAAWQFQRYFIATSIETGGVWR